MSVEKESRTSSQAPDLGVQSRLGDDVEAPTGEVPDDVERRDGPRHPGHRADTATDPEGRVEPPAEEVLGEPHLDGPRGRDARQGTHELPLTGRGILDDHPEPDRRRLRFGQEGVPVPREAAPADERGIARPPGVVVRLGGQVRRARRRGQGRRARARRGRRGRAPAGPPAREPRPGRADGPAPSSACRGRPRAGSPPRPSPRGREVARPRRRGCAGGGPRRGRRQSRDRPGRWA